MNMLKKLYRTRYGNKNLSEFEQQYVKLIEKITKVKTLRSTRNGNTKSLFSEELKFKVDNVQLLQGRKIFIKGVLGELAAFLKKPTHVKDFEEQGCNYWKKWAGEDGSLKLDYGNAWFDFNGYDQIAELKHNLKNDPTNRRMVISGWNPANLENLSLPCCHLLYQFYVTDDNELSMIWYQRSVDVMIGLPSDALFASVWLIAMATEFNMKLGEITMQFGDCHIYESHLDNVQTYINNTLEVNNPPEYSYKYNPESSDFCDFVPSDIVIENYNVDKVIKFELL